MIRAVWFDVGETLVDETPAWEAVADALGVPRFTLMGVLGGLAGGESRTGASSISSAPNGRRRVSPSRHPAGSTPTPRAASPVCATPGM